MKRVLGLCVVLFLSTAAASAQPATPGPSKAKAPAVTVQAARWAVDPAQSSIGFSSSVGGQAFRGAFTRWTAFIAFDPAVLPTSRVQVVIEPASAASGDASRDSTLKQSNWFDTSRFPKAVFEAVDFRSLGANRYEARGTLEIKGRKTPVTLPFTLAINGAAADMQASVSLDRRVLGLGADVADATVPASVAVSIRVKATRTP